MSKDLVWSIFKVSLKCAGCGEGLNNHLGPAPNRPGDVLVCLHCGTINIRENDNTLRKASVDEERLILAQDEGAAIVRVRSKIYERHRKLKNDGRTLIVIPYEPIGNEKEKKVGHLLVVGNDSFATVCKTGFGRVAVHTCDNDKDGHETSAFERAEKWAKENQDKGSGGLLGL